MSIKIIDECINCGACAVECPTEAINGPGESWEENGKYYNPISNDHYFIVLNKCNECAGVKKIKCIAVCPMDAIENELN
jgi:ferredoxin